MSIVSGIFLVYVLATSPVISVQVVQQTDSVEACQAQISSIASEEKDEKESEQIAPRLKCLGISYRVPDDPPKKSPANYPSENEHSCKKKIV